MAKRLYVGNSTPVAQVNRILIRKGQYLQQHIAEGSALVVTINEKTITARAHYSGYELATDSPWTEVEDSEAVQGLLQNLYAQWTSTTMPEFKEVKCSQPAQDGFGNWYVDLTATVPGVPFTATVSAPFPTVDVDTVREGAVGTDGEFTFEIDSVAVGGNFIIQWDVGGGVETSALIPYPIPNAAAVKTAIVAGMASIGDADIEVTVAAGVYTLKLQGDLASTTVSVPEIITTNLTGGGEVFSATLRDGNSGTVNDTFSGSSSHLLSAHTSDTGQGWTVSGTNAAWLNVSGGKLTPTLAYTGGSYNFDHNSKALSQYVGVTDAIASVTVSNWGVYNWWLNHVNHGTGIGDGAHASVLASAYTAGIKLHTRHDSDNDTIYLQVNIAPEDNGGRAAKSTTLNATGKTGTMTVAIKKVVGGTTTTIATTTVDRDFATWKYNGSAHVYATSTGGGSGVASGNLIAPLEDSSMSFDIKEVGGTVTGHVIDPLTGVTTTVTGALSTFTGTGTAYGMSFDFSTDNQTSTSPGGSPTALDNFSIVDAGDPDERQSLWTNGPGGTFDAMDDAETTTAADISATISRADLQDRLEEIYGVGGISVYDGSGTAADPWLLRFIGANSATNMAQIKGVGDNLTGIAQATVETIELGSPGVSEQWSVAIVGASGGTYKPMFKGIESDSTVAWNGNAAALETQLETIDIEQEDGTSINLACTVTGAGSVADPFIITLDDVYAGIDMPQLVILPDNLTGSDYPVYEYTLRQASHGPWHAKDVLNWVDAETNEYGLPATSGDSIHFEWGDQLHCLKYDLDFSAYTFTGVYIDAGFTSNAVIGLPTWNQLGYYEYRDTEWVFQLASPNLVLIGAKTGGGSPLIKFTTGSTKALITVYTTATPAGTEKNAVQFHGTHADNTLEMLGGFVGVAWEVGQEATIDKLTQRGGSVMIGHDVTLGDIVQTAGKLVADRITHTGSIEMR